MYDPLTREGLVCVNGRCISNKRKMQMHHEDQIGLHGGNGRGRRRGGLGQNGRNTQNGRGRRGRAGTAAGRARHNGIPLNPNENLDEIDEDQLENDSYEYQLDEYGEEYGDEDLVPF